MRNADVARLFDEMGDLLEIQGANAFRVRAYRNAARTISDMKEEVAELDAGQLTGYPGIGKELATKIVAIVTTGTAPQLEELRQQVPAGVREMLLIPNLGPKKAAVLFQELQLKSISDLKFAAANGQIAKLKGFGKKTEQAILEGLEQIEHAGRRFSIAEAKPAAEEIVEAMLRLPSVTQASVAGSCRRRKDTCGDLDVLVTAQSPDEPMDALARHRLVEKVLARGDTKQTVRLFSGLQLDLRVVPDSSYGAALQYFSGSKEHNIVIRARAQKRGMKVNEYGVFRGDEQIGGRTEEEVYRAVDLPWIPPELRENRGEIELAEQGRLPHLIEVGDICGDLHMHTTASDGKGTIREMSEAARARGLEYIAITDHSKRVSMANGLDADRLRAHWREIEAVRNDFSDLKILLGVECDILEDATMDLDDVVLSEAEWVVAVLHYGLKQPREQIMKRLMCAIRNPHVCAIGHPSGRMIGHRPGADIDYATFMKAAADNGVMLEINAHPSRLDLDEIQAAAAKDLGIPIVINTDSHNTAGFDVLPYGIDQARRAGLEAKDVANTRPIDEFLKMLRTAR